MDMLPKTDTRSVIGRVFDDKVEQIETQGVLSQMAYDSAERLAAICRRFRTEEEEEAASLIPQPVDRLPLGERVSVVMAALECDKDIAVALLEALDRNR